MTSLLPIMLLTAGLSTGAPAPGAPAAGAGQAAARLDSLVARAEPALRRHAIETALSRSTAALGDSMRRDIAAARLPAPARAVAAAQPSGRAHEAYSAPETRR